ncbi:unnamed protein product [Closterium sp. NIES-65]|nr:unnamed protein product [Closterium sp. NIES-65]
MPNPGFVPLSADPNAEEGNEIIDNVTLAEFEDTQRENREFRRRLMEYENERRNMQRAAANSPTNNGGEGTSNPTNSPDIGQAEDASPDGGGQAGAGGNATRNNGVAAATMLPPVPSVIRVEPNRNAIQNAVKLAHNRGVILDLQQLSSMQLTWAHRYAAALACVPDIHNGFKGAAKRAVEIMYFETPDVDLEYWTPRDTNITALCTAIGITDADYVAKVRLVMENERMRPSHLRKQQQDARNKVHTMGRVMLYESFNIRIARPDRGREVVGTLSPAAFCAEHRAAGTHAGQGVGKEQEGQKSVGKGQEAQQSVGKEQEGHKSVGKEQEGQKSVGKEQEGQKSVGKEQEGQQSVGKEQEGQQSVGKEQEGQKRVGKEQEGQKSVGKEQEGQQSVGKEQEGQQSVGKEQEGH